MPFTPRSAADIAESWLAKMLARTELTDVVEGSSLWFEAFTTAEELAHTEFRLQQLRNSFYLQSSDLVGDALVERGNELPVNAVPKLGKTSASGTVMQVYRKDAVAVQTLPAGSIFRRTDGVNLYYKTIVPYTFAIGVVGIDNIYVVCTEQGAQGNAPAGVIATGQGLPDWVIGVANTLPITNGSDGETDEQYRARLLLYLSSLARSQRSALEFLGTSFIALDGSRCRFAKCFTDNKTPGYVELVVDDGTDLSTAAQTGPLIQGIVPTGGQTIFPHAGPATEPIQTMKLVRGAQTLILQNGVDMFSYPELGYIEALRGLPKSPAAGDVYYIGGNGASAYSTFTGIISELQQAVNGNVADPVALPGWKAEGVRVRVVPPDVIYVSMDLVVVPVNNVSLAELQAEVLVSTIEFMASLGPGEPLYIAQLINVLTDNPNLLNVRVYNKGESTAKPDVYPGPREVLRSSLSNLSVISASYDLI